MYNSTMSQGTDPEYIRIADPMRMLRRSWLSLVENGDQKEGYILHHEGPTYSGDYLCSE